MLSIDAYPRTAASPLHPPSFPGNKAISDLSSGLADAHKAYGSSKSVPALPLCILFIVQEPENNIFDQFALSTFIVANYHIPVYYLPFGSILTHTTVSHHKARTLIYTPPHSSSPHEVTLCYFRAGYSPTEYTSSESWLSRLQLERSAAIKCPSILTHLAGCKKVQQILATPSSPHLTRFMETDPYSDRIQQTFADIFPLDATPAGQHAIQLATDPERAVKYVLKPQREGGGNNVYGANIPAFLKSLGEDRQKWRAHILMELIESPPRRNSILRNGVIKTGEVIGELGIYGVCLWESGKSQDAGHVRVNIIKNAESGWLLRTKGRKSEEGGVAAGFGAVDSLCLVDEA